MTRQVLDALSERSEQAIAGSVASTALALERAVCMGRVPFLAALIVRFLCLGDHSVAKTALTVVPLSAGLIFSVYILLFVKDPPLGEGRIVTSVTLDALACHFSLLPNALWPWPTDYTGILFIPDAAGVLVATIAAGLRLSTRAAVLGGVLNVASVLVLAVTDREVSGARFAVGAIPVTLYVIFLGVSAGLTLIFSVSVRRLVRRSALEALRADRAEQGLGSLLADSHDLSSLLTAAAIDADLVADGLERPPGEAQRRRLADRANRLRRALNQIAGIVVEVKSRALGDQTALGERVDVDLRAVAERVVEPLRTRFGDVAFEVRVEEPESLLVVAGGEPTLARILLNLLENAVEGDGSERSSTVTIRAERTVQEDVVAIHVEDDGPGFSSRLGGGSLELPVTTKPGGRGLGLSIARGLVEASGGQLSLASRAPSGARVTFTLPSRVVVGSDE